MVRHKRLFILCVLACVCVFMITWFCSGKLKMTYVEEKYIHIDKARPAFLVDTSKCKILNVDPFEKSIIPFVRTQGPITCFSTPSITYVDGTKLRLNWTAINSSPYNGDFKYCVYRAIFRPPQVKNHNYFDLSDMSQSFNDTIEMQHEFIRVTCMSNSDGKIYTNYHSFILPDHARSQSLEVKYLNYKSTVDETMNVVMLGLDSISRLNFLRQMPKTLRYLVDDLKAVDLMGYNKVADNTFVNIVPMTLGKFLEELPWNETLAHLPFDKYNFIWKQFADKGYHTLYAEDAPKIAIFDYFKAGFHQPPADYFNRVMNVAMESDRRFWNKDHNCFKDKLETNLILEYLKDFAELYKKNPYFAFVFITRLTHGIPGGASVADIPYFNFLREMNDSGRLSNTVLFFYSDHGMRFGPSRETYVGKLEERLPIMYIVFPKWFRQKYPELVKNLRVNSNRLTTPFDIYETLSNILNFNREKVGHTKQTTSRGLSLLSEIPENRSCESASILPHWCTCVLHQELPVSGKSVRKMAELIIQGINKKMEHLKDKCHVLSVKKLEQATKLVPSDKVLTFAESKNDVIDRYVRYGKRATSIEDYQLTVRASPSDALFEATIRYTEVDGSYTPVGAISRINAYGSQSHCVSEHTLKMYCFCKNNL